MNRLPLTTNRKSYMEEQLSFRGQTQGHSYTEGFHPVKVPN